MRALIIDPSAPRRRLLESHLRERDHRTTGVDDAKSAVRAHRKDPFDLVSIDWEITDLSPLELLAQLRKVPGGEPTVAMLVGGEPRHSELEKLFEAGIDDWLPRSMSTDAMLARILVIESLVQRAERRRKAEEVLRRSQARVELADRLASVGTLAAGVAHELNNPLSYVLSNLRLLAEELERIREQVPPESRRTLAELVDESSEGATRMGQIVRDLKTFARADDEARGPVDLGPIIESSINMVSNELRHRGRLSTDLGPTPKVEANESRIGQVAVNLLLNATHALPEDHPGEVRVRTRTDERGWAEITVEDTGHGIEPDDLARIFDPFFTTKPAGEGTGLGLSICHNIVTNAGGQIRIHSNVGEGTRVCVSFPPAQRVRRRPQSSMRMRSVGTAKRARVLVVDDEPMVARSLRRALRGHDVSVVQNGEEAVELLTSGERFDVVLCDLMMPEVTGMDVYERVRVRSPGVEERIVFMTGGAFTPKGRNFLDSVDNEQIEKPFDLALVREIVAQAAGGDD